MQMSFYRIDRLAHGIGDFLYLHLLRKAHEECGALIQRKRFDNGIYLLHSFLRKHPCLLRGLLSRHKRRDLVNVQGRLFGLFPKLNLLAP